MTAVAGCDGAIKTGNLTAKHLTRICLKTAITCRAPGAASATCLATLWTRDRSPAVPQGSSRGPYWEQRLDVRDMFR